MKKALAAALILVLCWSAAALAATPQEVVDLVKSVVKFYDEKGEAATLAAINDKNGPFFKGELYIFMGKIDKIELMANPVSPHLVGKDMTSLKDVKGKLFFAEMRNIARDKGEGWMDYWWIKPNEKEASPKASYVKRAADGKVYFGCGVYGIEAKAAESQAK